MKKILLIFAMFEFIFGDDFNYVMTYKCSSHFTD